MKSLRFKFGHDIFAGKTLNLDVFNFIKQLKNSHSNIKDFKNIEKLMGVATLPHSCPPENCHLCTKNEILCTFLHATV